MYQGWIAILINEIDQKLKSLAVSVASQVDTPKCSVTLAKRPSLTLPLKKLRRALERHKGNGYDVDSKPLPILQQTTYLIDQIDGFGISVVQLQKSCHLITQLEKTALIRYIDKIMETMDGHRARAEHIANAIKNAGLNMADLS